MRQGERREGERAGEGPERRVRGNGYNERDTGCVINLTAQCALFTAWWLPGT